MKAAISNAESLTLRLRELKLPSFVGNHQEVAILAEKSGWSFSKYLLHLGELEVEDRKARRIARNLKRSNLAPEKTLSTLELQKLPAAVRRQIPSLCEGKFLDEATNILAFGLPGRGKSHVISAIGHELIHRGYTVLFIPAYSLVQQLLMAKRDLTLEKTLRRLDRFDLICVDDLGYVKQDRDEMEVLFTFLSERYERRSVAITSNLVFSQWERIFKDPLTTACAIDRLIHYSTILELTGTSYRSDAAKRRREKGRKSTKGVEPTSPS